MSDSCNRFLKQLQKRLQQTGMTQLDGTVVRESSSTHELLVELTANAPLEAGYLKGHFADMERESPLLRGIVVTHPQGTIVIGQDSLTENIEGHSFQIGSGCFFQINGSILGQALRHIRSALGLTEHETLADLYSGIGTFGIACAQKTASVIAVENNPRNIALLRRNCLINSLRNITIIDRDVEIWLRQRHIPRCDAMLVDPPRKGLDPQVSKSLLRHTPSRIYYLSCNPATLLRDLIILTQRYAIKDIALFDFFPHTPHIETGVLLHLR